MARAEAVALLTEMGRTDVLLAAIAAEVEKHRTEFDDDPDIRVVTVQVRYNRSSGLPRTVIIGRESEHDYS